MAGSINKVILVGNLGRDPEIRFMNDGTKLAQLSIATGESWKDRQTGERRERTEWHRVVIFNDALASVAEQYCKKGSKVYVEGQLQTRKWQGQDGRDNYTTEVVLTRFRGELTLLDSRNSQGQGDYGASYDQSQPAASSPSSEPKWDSPTSQVSNPSDDLDDEIPF